MAATVLNFSDQNGNYVSDAIKTTDDNIAIQIKYETPGGTSLERSIDGVDFVPCASIMSYGSKENVIERNVSGIVVGTNLRIRFLPGVVPTEIKVLQHD